MKIQPKYTVTEATELLGFSSRSTINKRTKDGTLSYNLDDNGNKTIDAAELQRLFKDKYAQALSRLSNTANTEHAYSTKTHTHTTKSSANTSLLEHKVHTLEEQLNYERSERERERTESKEQIVKYDTHEQNLLSQLNKAQETITRQTYLLEHHKDSKAQNRPGSPSGEQVFDLASQGYKNNSMAPHELLLVIIIAITSVLLGISTNSYWLPYAKSLF